MSRTSGDQLPDTDVALGGNVRITASAISLNVDDVIASASFLTDHFGFAEVMADDGFASLTDRTPGSTVVHLRTGLTTFKPEALAGRRADGLLLVFVVDDIDAEYARIQAEGVSDPHSAIRAG